MSPTYRGITSTCPGDTGNGSSIAKQRSFAQTHSASGTARNGERAELERRLADSVANPDAVRPWADVEAEALARAKR